MRDVEWKQRATGEGGERGEEKRGKRVRKRWVRGGENRGVSSRDQQDEVRTGIVPASPSTCLRGLVNVMPCQSG